MIGASVERTNTETLVGIWVEKSAIWTCLNTSLQGLQLPIVKWTGQSTSMNQAICIILLRIGRTSGQASIGCVICPLLDWWKTAWRLAASMVLRVSIVSSCHTDIVTHSLVGIRAINSDLCWTNVDTDTSQVPHEARLASWQKTISSACFSGVLTPWARVSSSRSWTHFHTHRWDIFSIVDTSIDSWTHQRWSDTSSLDMFSPCSNSTFGYTISIWSLLSKGAWRTGVDTTDGVIITKSAISSWTDSHTCFCGIISKLQSTIGEGLTNIDAQTFSWSEIGKTVSGAFSYTGFGEVICVHLSISFAVSVGRRTYWSALPVVNINLSPSQSWTISGLDTSVGVILAKSGGGSCRANYHADIELRVSKRAVEGIVNWALTLCLALKSVIIAIVARWTNCHTELFD